MFSCREKNIDGVIHKKYTVSGFICVDFSSCRGGPCFHRQFVTRDEYVVITADDITKELLKFYVPKQFYMDSKIGDSVLCDECVDSNRFKSKRRLYERDISPGFYELLEKKYGKCNFNDLVENL